MSSQPQKVSPWVKAFVIFHLLAVTIWALPNPGPAIQEGRDKSRGVDKVREWNWRGFKLTSNPFRHYVLSTGFWQYWDMFAPNPAATDFYGEADVWYRDGTQTLYRYPRVYTLPIPEKYLKERYRKYFERAHGDNFKTLWPRFAQRIALLMTKDPTNPVVKVRLRRYWQQVAPPGKPQTGYTAFNYYTHAVDQKQLRRDLGR